MTEFLMPKLSDSMEQGTIISWLKDSGQNVAAGEEILEIETDKSTVACTAEVGGVLEILAPVGSTVAVGEVIARLSASSGSVPSSDPAPTPEADASTPGSAEPAPADVPLPTDAPAVNDNGSRAGEVKATPLARRIAAAHGIVLADVCGTGPLGRITRADVLAKAGVAVAAPAPPRSAVAAPASAPSAAAPSVPTAAASPAAGTKIREISRLQQLIAHRMVEAKTTIPHFQVQTEVQMDAALALRSELKRVAGEGQPVPSINDIIIKASAVALRSHPLANGSYTDAGIELHEAINIGMPVAAEEALIVPTIFNVDTKSLGQVAIETRQRAASVRNNTISPQELSGGTFTVSNLGMFGMTAITPVINPPQAAILGVGTARPTLARVDGEIVERTLLTLTLSCDHRILYGADAALFLAAIRDLLESPLRIAL